MTEYLARVILRYGAGAIGVTGLARDPDMVAITSIAVSAGLACLVEWWTGRARKAGRRT